MEDYSSSCWVSHHCLCTCHSLSWAELSSPTYSTTQLCTGPRAASTEERALLVHIVVIWTWGGPQAGWEWQSSVSGWAVWWQQLEALTVASVQKSVVRYEVWAHMDPTCPVLWLHNRVELVEAGVLLDCEGQRGCDPEVVSEQAKGNSCWDPHRQHIEGSLDLCLQLTHHSTYSIFSKEPTQPPLASALLLSAG